MSTKGPVAEIVVRNWGALTFIGLVLTYGRQYLDQQVGVSVAIDSAMVLLFVAYLVLVRRET